jgi:hypothetical protein
MTLARVRPLVVRIASVVLAACAHTPAAPSPRLPANIADSADGFTSSHYKDPTAWLCLPGREDACATSLDATELLPDGTRNLVRDTMQPGADKVDCFYVYPTVDLSLGPANHQSFTDTAPMTRATVAQAARFRSTCRLFVPLYRQATIGSYLRSPETRDQYLAVAASDVLDAFAHYLGAYNEGRKIVLIGHSQGAEMITRVLSRFFDADGPAGDRMRERLLLALPIGGNVEVPKGAASGATFHHLAACTRAGETGCVVAYRSFVGGVNVDPDRAAPKPGNETICVNPAELDGAPRSSFSRAFFPSTDESRLRARGIEGITTPFVMLRNFYDGQCVTGRDGFRYLAVSMAASTPPVGDARVSPVELSSRWFRGKLGLHVLDFQFAQGDLVDLVARRARALP